MRLAEKDGEMQEKATGKFKWRRKSSIESTVAIIVVFPLKIYNVVKFVSVALSCISPSFILLFLGTSTLLPQLQI